MATYSATVQLNGGKLTVTRPHPSTDDVDSIVDGLVFSVRDPESPVSSIGVTIVTDDGPPAATPPLPDGGQHADPADSTAPAADATPAAADTTTVTGPLTT